MVHRLSRYGDRALVCAASITLALEGIDRPKEFWPDHGYLVGTAFAVLIVFGVFGPFERLSARHGVGARERAWQNGLDTLDTVEALSQIPIRQLTIHIWVPRRTLRSPIRRELSRPISVRVGYQRTNRTVQFRHGKGVVGQCWRSNDEVVRTTLASDFDDIQSEANWTAAQHRPDGAEFTMGLDYSEFIATQHLTAVVAVPIKRHRKFVGCVSADTEDELGPNLELGMPAIRRLAHELASVDLAALDD
jgi:hypothetical protein